jgi:hypothetical protein
METTKVTIRITINDKRYEAHTETMTGAQLKHLAGIPEANLLFRELPGPSDDELINNDSVVHLRNGEHFYDMPPGNFGER